MLRVNGKLKAALAGAFAAALCFALAGCAGSSGSASSSAASSAGSSASAASEASSTNAPIGKSASAAASSAAAAASSAAASSSAAATSSSAAASATSSAAASSAGSAPKASSDLVDEHNNITIYSIIESTGPELVSLMKQQGYEWDGQKGLWARAVDGASFVAVRNSGQYSQDDYQAATSKGDVATAVASNVVGGYKDAEAALKGNAHCVVVDSYFESDGTGIAIVYGPSMTEYLVILQPYSESTTEIDIYSKGAVGSGMLDQVYGRQIGGSFQEVWKKFTGRDSYGH